MSTAAAWAAGRCAPACADQRAAGDRLAAPDRRQQLAAWQTDITAARLDGPFEPGNSFTWTSYGYTVTPTIYAVADRARTLWRGANRGIMGTHEWVYTQTPTGTHVATHESWSGQPVEADPAGMQAGLDKSLTDWLGHLKATAESTS